MKALYDVNFYGIVSLDHSPGWPGGNILRPPTGSPASALC